MIDLHVRKQDRTLSNQPKQRCMHGAGDVGQAACLCRKSQVRAAQSRPRQHLSTSTACVSPARLVVLPAGVSLAPRMNAPAQKSRSPLVRRSSPVEALIGGQQTVRTDISGGMH
jgi:hypothetical protein